MHNTHLLNQHSSKIGQLLDNFVLYHFGIQLPKQNSRKGNLKIHFASFCAMLFFNRDHGSVLTINIATQIQIG